MFVAKIRTSFHFNDQAVLDKDIDEIFTDFGPILVEY